MVVYTATITVGVSNEDERFSRVYGYFTGVDNGSAEQGLQMLFRCRRLRQVRVAVDAKRNPWRPCTAQDLALQVVRARAGAPQMPRACTAEHSEAINELGLDPQNSVKDFLEYAKKSLDLGSWLLTTLEENRSAANFGGRIARLARRQGFEVKVKDADAPAARDLALENATKRARDEATAAVSKRRLELQLANLVAEHRRLVDPPQVEELADPLEEGLTIDQLRAEERRGVPEPVPPPTEKVRRERTEGEKLGGEVARCVVALGVCPEEVTAEWVSFYTPALVRKIDRRGAHLAGKDAGQGLLSATSDWERSKLVSELMAAVGLTVESPTGTDAVINPEGEQLRAAIRVLVREGRRMFGDTNMPRKKKQLQEGKLWEEKVLKNLVSGVLWSHFGGRLTPWYATDRDKHLQHNAQGYRLEWAEDVGASLKLYSLITQSRALSKDNICHKNRVGIDSSFSKESESFPTINQPAETQGDTLAYDPLRVRSNNSL